MYEFKDKVVQQAFDKKYNELLSSSETFEKSSHPLRMYMTMFQLGQEQGYRRGLKYSNGFVLGVDFARSECKNAKVNENEFK